MGGVAVEARLDGGLEARRRSVERRRRSVASGQGKSERVRGKDQGEPPGSGARERKEWRALSWPGHGGGEVAAARSFWAAWRREGAPARGRRAVEEERRDAWVPARGELMAGKPLHNAGGGAVGGRRRETEQGGGGGRKGQFCNFQKFQGPLCKQAITFKLKLKWKSAQHESCSTFQDLQL